MGELHLEVIHDRLLKVGVSSCLYPKLEIGDVIHDHLLRLGQSLAVLLDMGESGD